jgi:hypothetical protein
MIDTLVGAAIAKRAGIVQEERTAPWVYAYGCNVGTSCSIPASYIAL